MDSAVRNALRRKPPAILALVLYVLLRPAAAQIGNPELSVRESCPLSTAGPGTSITIHVDFLSMGTEVGGFAFQLAYFPATLTLADEDGSVTLSDALSNLGGSLIVTIDDRVGIVQVVYPFAVPPLPLIPDGEVVWMAFRVEPDAFRGCWPLQLTKVDFVNLQGRGVPIGIPGNGGVEVIPTTTSVGATSTTTTTLSRCLTNADCEDGDVCTIDTCVPVQSCQRRQMAPDDVRAPITESLEMGLCSGQRVPKRIERLQRQADKLLRRASESRKPKKAKRSIRKALKKLSKAEKKAARAGRREKISGDCADVIVAKLRNARTRGQCL